MTPNQYFPFNCQYGSMIYKVDTAQHAQTIQSFPKYYKVALLKSKRYRCVHVNQIDSMFITLSI